MLLQCLTKDNNIIKVSYIEFIKKLIQNVINISLKGSRTITYTKRHYYILIEFVEGNKGREVLILVFNAYLIKRGDNINFRKVL